MYEDKRTDGTGYLICSLDYTILYHQNNNKKKKKKATNKSKKRKEVGLRAGISKILADREYNARLGMEPDGKVKEMKTAGEGPMLRT